MVRVVQFAVILLAWAMAGPTDAARGSVVVKDNGGGYPDIKWAASQAFSSMYNFAFNGSESPKIYTGFSCGGDFSYFDAVGNPSGTLCATPSSWKHAQPSDKVRDVPILTTTMDGDWGSYDVEIAQQANSKGHRECVVWDRGKEHSFCDPDMVYLFWIECIRLRYPSGSSLQTGKREDGWLGDMSRASWDSNCPYIASYRDYRRDKSVAAWLPTRSFAFCWRAYTVGKGRTRVAPVQIISPKKTDRWAGWPTFEAGSTIPIRATTPTSGVKKVGFYYGDNVIAIIPAMPYGVYTAQWKNAEAGIHGISVICYDDQDRPIATSLLSLVIVKGTVSFKAVDNSSMENPELPTQILHQRLIPLRANGPALPYAISPTGFLLNGRMSEYGAQKSPKVLLSLQPERHGAAGCGGSLLSW